jgi:hypothetical protein
MEYPDTITVEVTQEDIDHGARSACTGCPVAIAASRISSARAIVGRTGLTLYDYKTGKTARYNTPSQVSDFIATFDNTGPSSVQPFTFTATKVSAA